VTRSLTTAAVLLSTACLTLGACGGDTEAASGDQLVCVDQYATATVIDDILTGLDAGLTEAKADGLEVEVENPNADSATEQTLAQKFIDRGCDVVVPVGTSAAQLMAGAMSDVPIVFAASSSPAEAKLVDSLESPGRNVTGVSDALDTEAELDGLAQLLPDLKKVGLLWKSGDPNGEAQAAVAKAHLDELGITYETATITNPSEVTQAAESLASKVQAIALPGDPTTISAAGGIVQVADDSGLPVVGGTSSAVEAGAVLASTYDYEAIGEEVAAMVLAVLDGADPATTPVVVPDSGGYDLNVTKLEELGIAVPDELRAAALQTY
jgi:putative tryptophan/tyrosine transport system substrate-binding protein